MNLQDVQNSYNFTDCTIVITGGAGVLGSEIACALVGCGAKVAILDRDLALAEKLVQRFPPVVTDRVVAVYGDVLQRDSLEQAREMIVKKLGFEFSSPIRENLSKA